jgi:hypothetical protein
MLREGRNEQEALQATTHRSEGREFAIRRIEVPGRVWLMRLSASAVVANQPVTITSPPSTPGRTTDGWLELRVK